MRLQEFVEYLNRLEEEEGNQAGPTPPRKPSEGKMRVLEELRALKFDEDDEYPCLDPAEEAGEPAEGEEEGIARLKADE